MCHKADLVGDLLGGMGLGDSKLPNNSIISHCVLFVICDNKIGPKKSNSIKPAFRLIKIFSSKDFSIKKSFLLFLI